jgi:hypothetical protein
MDRTALLVANALPAVGVKLIEMHGLGGADGGVGFHRDADQAELEQARPMKGPFYSDETGGPEF